jgi:hypothetical protein
MVQVQPAGVTALQAFTRICTDELIAQYCFVWVFLCVLDKLPHKRVTAIKKAHSSQHQDDNHVQAEQHVADFVLSGAFLVEILADACLGVGHVAFEVFVSLFGFLFALVELRFLFLLGLLLLLVLLLLLFVRDEFGESFG